MKLTLERNRLKALAERAANIVQSRNTIQILANVLLDAGSGSLKATATDLDRQIETIQPANVTQPGSTTVDAATLKGIAGKIPDGALVSLEGDGDFLHIQAGRQKYKLATLPAADFPRMKDGDYTAEFTMTGDVLKNILDKTAWAASSEETRFYLCGIALQVANGDAVAVATDGHRLARFKFSVAADFPDVIVPTRTVKEFGNILTADDATVSLNENKIRVKSGDTVLTSKLIDGQYPTWDRVIPKSNPNSITANSVDLRLAIDAVLPVDTETKTRAVKLSISDGTLGISIRANNGGDAQDEVDVEQVGAGAEIGLNSKYALEALEQSGKGDDVTIHYGTGMDPLLVEYASEPDLIAVIMPVRLA